jgi:hypothetical protein
MADSTIQALQTLTPAKQDLVLVVDQSDSYGAKKLTLEALMNFVLGNSAAFDISNGRLRLQNSLNANGKKITGLAAGEQPGDAVNYGTVSHLVEQLTEVSPDAPTIEEYGSHLRVSTTAIDAPSGGSYLFYWCVDQLASTELTVSGGAVVSGTGTVYCEGSVANVANILKTAGLVGRYLHVAVRYRNSQHVSPISATKHHLLSTGIFEDVFSESLDVKPPAELSLVTENNRLVISANPGDDVPPGTMYYAEIVMNNEDNYDVQGNEYCLIRLASYTPEFTYEVPVSASKWAYAHVRVLAVAPNGAQGATETVSAGYTYYSGNILDDALLGAIATAVADCLQTAGGEALVKK